MTVPGSAVVLVDVRLGAVLPAAALGVLRDASAVYAGSDLPAGVMAALDLPAAPAELPADRPVVVVAADLDEPAAAALHAAGATVLRTPAPAGAELLSAVDVMDRLRSPGGCPWDAEQTHESLRQYLVEEAFELLDAIDTGDRAALREELGDVLLQVLFHSRVAAEDPADPFTVDDVAAELVGKLVHRHPHVFAGGDPAVRDAVTQEHRWEELKQAEKQRQSSVDGVAMAQPAASLAGKLTSRATRAGLPRDLLPGNQSGLESGSRASLEPGSRADLGPGNEPGLELGNESDFGSGEESGIGDALFAAAAAAKLAGLDPEGELRAAGRRFAADLRAAERAARDAGVDPLAMDAAAWRKYWPR
jgi:XTP/dITP diphosphohydrolase